MSKESAFDRFTIGHAAFGYLLAGARIPAKYAIPIIIGWEYVETPLKRDRPEWFPQAIPDSFENALVDALAAFGGFYLYHHLEISGY